MAPAPRAINGSFSGPAAGRLTCFLPRMFVGECTRLGTARTWRWPLAEYTRHFSLLPLPTCLPPIAAPSPFFVRPLDMPSTSAYFPTFAPLQERCEIGFRADTPNTINIQPLPSLGALASFDSGRTVETPTRFERSHTFACYTTPLPSPSFGGSILFGLVNRPQPYGLS